MSLFPRRDSIGRTVAQTRWLQSTYCSAFTSHYSSASCNCIQKFQNDQRLIILQFLMDIRWSTAINHNRRVCNDESGSVYDWKGVTNFGYQLIRFLCQNGGSSSKCGFVMGLNLLGWLHISDLFSSWWSKYSTDFEVLLLRWFLVCHLIFKFWKIFRWYP